MLLATVPPTAPDGVVGDVDVDESATDAGGCAANALPDTVAVPATWPLLVDATVSVAEPDADNPVTVSGNTDPEPDPATTEPTPTDGVHDQLGSQFVTFTVKPSAVRTGVSKIGTREAPSALAATVAEPTR